MMLMMQGHLRNLTPTNEPLLLKKKLLALGGRALWPD
jgi:hypothetical protein